MSTPSAEPLPKGPPPVGTTAAEPERGPGGGGEGLSRRARGILLAAILAAHAGLALWLAWSHPAGSYFHDEKFNMENVESLLRGSGWANHWYAPLTYLPQTLVIGALDWLYEATDGHTLEVLGPDGGARTAAFHAARTVNVLWGTLSLALVYRLGRRLFGIRAGLLAAALAALSPWAIRTSIEFKPDPVLLLTTLLALGWLLDAHADPSWRSFARAGAGLGLAVSSKMNGVFLAPVVALAALSTLGRHGAAKRVGWVGTAALTSVVVYLVTSPFVRETLYYFGRIQRHYGRQGRLGPGELLVSALDDLSTWAFVGPWVALLGLASLAALAGIALVRRTAIDRERGLVALYPMVYLASFAATTGYYKANNFAQVVPFLGLGAGVFVTAVAGAVAARWSRLAGGIGAGVLSAALLIPAATTGARYAYRESVATVEDIVAARVRAAVPWLSPRILWVEGDGARELPLSFYTAERAIGTTSQLVAPSLPRIGGDRLALADALLFPAHRLEGRDGRFYRTLIDHAPPSGVHGIWPRPFRVQGEPVWLLLRPWEPVGDPLTLAIESTSDPLRFKLPSPEVSAGEYISIGLRVARTRQSIWLSRDGIPQPLFGAQYHAGRSYRVTTERWISGPAPPRLEVTLRLPLSGPPEGELEASWYRWRLPEP